MLFDSANSQPDQTFGDAEYLIGKRSPFFHGELFHGPYNSCFSKLFLCKLSDSSDFVGRPDHERSFFGPLGR